ncbi:phazolicin family TOMM bacteriocin [Rhizobium herbae]|uniref:Phazolicin family TOMM bacteriocin n=1 Tax=Rhizobium herbae TaxID=508661 RepID=A0ABS7HBL7_9HYPH|nr:phazolicin family TOMM bacteriocin [Rhizobium herbae]MBW9064659.1 phazolicin family TOMM bacteriocin [Rhizobium herbae]
MASQILNPPQFGTEIEFIDAGETPTQTAAATCSRCDSSSRCGASGKSSGSASSVSA